MPINPAQEVGRPPVVEMQDGELLAPTTCQCPIVTYHRDDPKKRCVQCGKGTE